MITRLPLLFIAALLAAASLAQSSGAAPQAAPRAVLEPVQGGWHSAPPPDKKEEVVRMQDDLDLHHKNMQETFQEVRMERNIALARNKGVLTEQDRADIAAKAAIIEQQAPHSFEAHMAQFYAEFPAPAAFQHLDRAQMRDPERSELIGPKLADAARRDHANDLATWSRKLKQHGEVAPGLWAFADDLLNSVETNGVLIAAGEMDAYPLWARQFAEGGRRDVLVVDHRLLIDPAYRQRIWANAKARGKVPENAGSFIPELAEAMDRPLYLSPALGRERIGLPQEKLYVVGLALQYGRSNIDNIPMLERRWAQMNKTTEAGPLSRNYLLPGVVLWRHYQQIEDEKNASLLEHEVRQLARAMNATKELYQVLDSPAPRGKRKHPATH